MLSFLPNDNLKILKQTSTFLDTYNILVKRTTLPNKKTRLLCSKVQGEHPRLYMYIIYYNSIFVKTSSNILREYKFSQ